MSEAQCRRLSSLTAALRPRETSGFTSLPVAAAGAGGFTVSVPSADGCAQMITVQLPPEIDRVSSGEMQPRPLLVSLHTWGGDYTQQDATAGGPTSLEHTSVRELCQEQEPGWIYIFPDFRGPNRRPEACGSELAQQDILSAIEWAKQEYAVDRVYLTGASGGGHMTLMMAARYPEIFAACSAWVGLSDLVSWHTRHTSTDPSDNPMPNYAAQGRACCGGAPGDSPAIDAEWAQRSPITFLAAAGRARLPLDINAGIHDGHNGSVPIRQSIDAFNAVAEAMGEHASLVSEREIQELSGGDGTGRLTQPRPGDCLPHDAVFGRAIHLRRHAGPARLSIFEGGHEGIGTAAIDFLRRFHKGR
jgi:pimeloyl-ACP methyl ester carboxylesterase